ncbi:MAG: hypothetical protein JSV79_09070 [Armatimonadota bacterium]|nr:MAG: hypothetical protein JSV79_09070 [Armatimonadota bacterium]
MSACHASVRPRGWEWVTVLCLAIAAAALTLAVSRPDLDDAFYVSEAAFSSGQPSEPLLASDTMHVEPALPFVFSTYRLATFEVLAGGLAHVLHLPAMDVIYRVFPPFWAVVVVLSIFLLAQELMPRRWLALGVVSLLLILVLGECHRGPANFAFVRIFQGKAVYLSAIVPAIYYLTARYFSPRGTSADAFLLGCAQVAAIGTSAFATLAAPMATVGALLSNWPLLWSGPRAKLWGGVAALAVPLPYVITAAMQVGTSLAHLQVETPSHVWASVFGNSQQYLVAILLLAGPVLATEALLRYRLAVPLALLFAVYLNPWISASISKHVTGPPLYWRVVWSFPVVIFAATSVCVLVQRMIEERNRRPLLGILSAVVLGLFALAAPFHTLRHDNGVTWHFAGRKIAAGDYAVAEEAMRATGDNGRMLAPDAISGIVSRFEEHPTLVSVRIAYTQALAPAMGNEAYRQRSVLWSFVSASQEPDQEATRAALNSLEVATVVLAQNSATHGRIQVLRSEHFRRTETINGYEIWIREPR